VPRVIRERTDAAKKWVSNSIRELNKPVSNVEEFVEQNNNLAYTSENVQIYRDKIDLYGQYYNLLTDFTLKVKKEDKDNFTECT